MRLLFWLCLCAAAILPAFAHGADSEGLIESPAMLDDFQLPPPEMRNGGWRAYMNFSRPEPESLPEYAVRVAYIVPNNRVANPTAIANIQYVMTQGVAFQKEMMERYGFGPKSYQLETEADGETVIVHQIAGANPDTYYNANPYPRAGIALLYNGYGAWADKQMWMIFIESYIQNPDGSGSGFNSLAGGLGSGDDGGIAVMMGSWMSTATPENLVDNTSINGLIREGWGPYGLSDTATQPFPSYGSTLSAMSSIGTGLVQHELTHAFGFNHNFRNGLNYHGSVVGHGHRGFRSWLQTPLYPNESSRIDYSEALALNVDRFYNPGLTYTDNTPPGVRIETAGTVALQNGFVNIDFETSDTTELAMAMLVWDTETVGEMPLSGASGSLQFRTAYFDKGTTNTYRVIVRDTSGNRTEKVVDLIVPIGSNAAPRANLDITPPRVTAGLPVSVNGSLFYDVDNVKSTCRVEFDFDGDLVFDTAPSAVFTVSHTYNTPGFYLVRTRVTDPVGNKTISSPVALRVDAQTPVALSRWSAE